MSPTTEPQINLFSNELPSVDDLGTLARLVNCSEINQLRFAEQVEANMGRTSAKAQLATGIGLFVLSRCGEAVDKLKKGSDCKEKYLYLAMALRRLGKFDEAIENLQTCIEHGADPLRMALEKASTYRQAGDFEAAAKELKACSNFENVSADYHCQLGRLQEAQGLYGSAAGNYRAAIELDPNHQEALFRLAYRCDLSGDEQAAIDYYKRVVSTAPVYVSALLNLAVLYEDMGEFDKASRCAEKVLEFHPNHQRAIMFKKDIDSSKTMFYDEEKEKRRTRKNQILETPISDFELSVRSRNCLKKMKIETLGDLLNITEAELLSYKNFGETSLGEIKAILEPRSLRLGMALDEQQFATAETPEEIDEEEQGILNKPIDDLQLSVRCRKGLQKLNIRTIGDLTRTTEAELLGCKNFGVTSLNEITKAIGNIGLALRSLD